jgi:NTP pyrophosphatase (non-canonical NTP hydrolase)
MGGRVVVSKKFQTRVAEWVIHTFGLDVLLDTRERSHRFLEEALELVQATGCTKSEAHQLVDYVFNRDVGEKRQEIGGVMVTLAGLCTNANVDMDEAAEDELSRCWTKVDKIRAKHAAKPRYSPLPGSTT